MQYIEVEKKFTFRMRGIGYWHPHWGHGTIHGQLETGRESIRLDDFNPTDFASIHLQNLVTATMGDRHGVGVVEQIAIGLRAFHRMDMLHQDLRPVALRTRRSREALRAPPGMALVCRNLSACT